MHEDKAVPFHQNPYTFLAVKIEAVEKILRKTFSDKTRCPQQLLYKDKDRIRTHICHVCT